MTEEVDPVTNVEDVPEGYVKSRLENGGYLPPLSRIKLPETRTQTALIRWLFELGYEVKVISSSLNVRYQQVRNMVTTQPKRAAREDLPELRIELLEMEDAVDMLLGMELERTFAEDRKSKKRNGEPRMPREPKKDGKPKGRVLTEDDFGNVDLDDENYGR